MFHRKLNRRSFLTAIAAIPILGRLVPKPPEQNPACIIADYMRAAGFTVDQASVDAAAAVCDQPVAFAPEPPWMPFQNTVSIEVVPGQTVEAALEAHASLKKTGASSDTGSIRAPSVG
jgi:hypothetical protein